ncbi:MAG: cytochrome c3 family protein [Myxococcota bacterium]
MVTTAALIGLGITAFRGDQRTALLPGATTHGHYQIELSCESCHTAAFTSADEMQQACVDCHGEELSVSEDSHPKSKFTDPRNASRVARLDARYCVTCHTEHRPEATATMGLSLPDDYCYQCHLDVADERPTHEGLGFDTCADAGCHNFHDNRALYEDFLVAHSLETANHPIATVLTRSSLAEADAPPVLVDAPPDGWTGSAHHLEGTLCADCHDAASPTDAGWIEDVPPAKCADCHEQQVTGFGTGRHGMRWAADLGPMTAGEARLPMRNEAADRQLDCSTCHTSHRYDTEVAAVDACLGCHDDEHSRAYATSPHAELWWGEVSGVLPEGSGVSCATCHLPRVASGDRVRVQHNQNDNLRPNEKMIRSVCVNCHGVGFSIDALADRALVLGNFDAAPGVHVESITMATGRLSERERTE